MNEKTIYEPHPVSPARKTELRALGYRIVDAVFRPPDAGEPPGGEQSSPTLTQNPSPVGRREPRAARAARK